MPCLVWREGANPRGPLSKWGLHLPLPTGTFLLLLEQFQPPGRYPCRAPFPTPSTLFPPSSPRPQLDCPTARGPPTPDPSSPFANPCHSYHPLVTCVPPCLPCGVGTLQGQGFATVLVTAASPCLEQCTQQAHNNCSSKE